MKKRNSSEHEVDHKPFDEKHEKFKQRVKGERIRWSGTKEEEEEEEEVVVVVVVVVEEEARC